MSPMPQPQRTKIAASNNLYTVILAIALGVMIATAVFVAFMCQTQYGQIFGVPS